MTIGSALDTLFDDVAARKDSDPKTSYTAKLLNKGLQKCAKKMGEEAVELVIALVSEEEEDVINEAADLFYHFAVALTSRGIDPAHVANVLEKRRGIGGLDEKAARKND